MHDPVNHPKHYEIVPGLEAIDVIRRTLTPEEFRGYCIGNLLKYRLRAGKKDKLEQDIDKANTYAAMLEEAVPVHANVFDVNCGPLSDCSKCKNPCK